jgi:response regulator RpfG family c-di-GMP phosphodiesterase
MADNILCVDDDAGMLDFFRMIGTYQGKSSRPFQIEAVQAAEKGLSAIAARGPYAVIVCDMQMPGMNGIQFFARARQLAPDSVRVMLTGCSELQVAIEAVNDGNIFRFLTKPCAPDTLIKTITAGAEHYRLVTSEKDLLEKTLTGSIQVLSDVLGVVNPTAFGRATRVRELVKRLACQLKVENAWQLEIAAMLSQMGCVAVPEQVLRRVCRGVELGPDEARMFAEHPRLGHDLIAHIPRLEMVAAAIAYQEKQYGGAEGPPDEKKGEDIPLGARVLKVALDFDSLESKGLSKEHALECMSLRTGWYDPSILKAMETILVVETGLILKEVSVKDLMEKLEAIHGAQFKLQRVTVQELLGRMVLAENVWTTKDILVLSKGHEITLPLLERLRNYSRNAVIREPIQVWVSVRPGPSAP